MGELACDSFSYPYTRAKVFRGFMGVSFEWECKKRSALHRKADYECDIAAKFRGCERVVRFRYASRHGTTKF